MISNADELQYLVCSYFVEPLRSTEIQSLRNERGRERRMNCGGGGGGKWLGIQEGRGGMNGEWGLGGEGGGVVWIKNHEQKAGGSVL